MQCWQSLDDIVAINDANNDWCDRWCYQIVKNNIVKDVRNLIANFTKKFQHIYCNVMMTNDLFFDDKHVFISNFVIDNRQTDFRFAVDKLIDKFLTMYEIFSSKHAFHHFDENDRDDINKNQDNEKKSIDDDLIVNSVKLSKKKRTIKHSNSNKFTNNVNFEWFTWKINVYDKLTINRDCYEISLFMITTIINWIDDKVAKYIQSRRYNNLNYLKSKIMMIFFRKHLWRFKSST